MKTKCNTANIQQKTSSYIAMVERLYEAENTKNRYRGTLKSMLEEFFAKTSKRRHVWKRETFKSLLIHLHNQGCYGILRSYEGVRILHNISNYGYRLVRPVEDWKRSSLDKETQISALIQHCFAKYPTPAFMEQAFTMQINVYMLWYIQLGSGKSVKDLSQFPMTFTKRMAHEFRNAPENMSITSVLRYAQALGFGASKSIAKIIAYSDLMHTPPNHEAFWSSVVQFFAKVERLHLNELDLMLEYVGYKYDHDKQFSMKGRTFNALLEQANEWKRKNYFDKHNCLYWDASGIPPLSIEEELNGQKVIYRIIELRNSYDLYEEGHLLDHCVAEYDEDCHDGDSAIFSLRKEVMGKPVERLATLEVKLEGRELVQAKAKNNDDPSPDAAKMITRWMGEAGVGQKVDELYCLEGYQPDPDRQMIVRTERSETDWNVPDIIKLVCGLLFVIIKIVAMNSTIGSAPISRDYQELLQLDLKTSVEELKKRKQLQDSILLKFKTEQWQNLN